MENFHTNSILTIISHLSNTFEIGLLAWLSNSNNFESLALQLKISCYQCVFWHFILWNLLSIVASKGNVTVMLGSNLAKHVPFYAIKF